ncbi:hypothetical protein AYR66_06495 [Noviherbaspirillum denitrificans]|uniref:Uncharacterized protein n=2 Tax=Noviherbaspirillum denitrificans TaxID=1968433 RepID=A0A254T959_9BURK|nr:hypothetical protein AYR66_06495 [Noviherbaspirillum denitrificans]
MQESAYEPSEYDLQLRRALIDHVNHLLASSAEGWIPLGQDREGRYPWERIGIKREVLDGIFKDFVYAELITIEIDPVHGLIARRVEHTSAAASVVIPNQLLDDGADT